MSAAGEKILRSIRSLKKDLEEGRPLIVHVPDQVDVRAIRERLGLSRARFAAEQGHRRPEGPARVLLTVIDREPEAVATALAAA
jgi:putative transcriptional regulator